MLSLLLATAIGMNAATSQRGDVNNDSRVSNRDGNLPTGSNAILGLRLAL